MSIDDPRVTEALGRTEIMALSTVDHSGTWTSPVRFTASNGLRLTFQSMSDTRHVSNILDYPRASAAIYQWPGPEGGNIGLQVSGRIETSLKADDQSGGWHSFTLVPDEAWLFDSRGGLKERERIDV